MSEFYTPSSLTSVTECIREHVAGGKSLDVRTNGGLIKLGREMTADAVLSLAGFSQVISYEPEELVITLGPGVRLADLNEMLGQGQQELRFEPPDYGPLYGIEKGSGSIGGVVGANLSGPRRFLAGAARDFILGVQGVSGFGQEFKAGGRVVKNVTGYDVSKLMTGSYGTLAALTAFTLKLSPRAEVEATIAVLGLDVTGAVALMANIASQPFEVTGLAYIPEDVMEALEIVALSGQKPSVTLIRLEGARASLEERRQGVLKAVDSSSVLMLDMEESQTIWQAVRDVQPLNPPAEIPLWRVSAPLSMMAELIADNAPDFYYLDWAGGLAWLALEDMPKMAEGAAWLIRAPDKNRVCLPFMNKKDAVTEALMLRVKNAFDPEHMLNPGRMVEGQ